MTHRIEAHLEGTEYEFYICSCSASFKNKENAERHLMNLHSRATDLQV